MLYDPKWSNDAAVSLDTLIAWLETMPPEQYYDPCIPKSCLFGQYFTARGFSDVGKLSIAATDTNAINSTIAFGTLDDMRWTFGAALNRARNIQVAA